MSRTNTPSEIARAVTGLLASQLKDPARAAFFVWARQDRAIVGINPENVKNIDAVYSERFAHHLATTLGGVRVERTNSRGIYYQVSYTPRPPARLETLPLDLTRQPGGLYVPIGVTRRGPLWLSIMDIGSALIGGTRRTGKTRLIHAWVQALIAGGECELVLYDGKNGLEFSRYANEHGVTYTADLQSELERLVKLAGERKLQFEPVKATNLSEYNDRVPADIRLRPIVVFVDEAATLPVDTVELLRQMIAVDGAHGIIPVLATQRTGVDEVPAAIKTNLATRICFPVPAVQDSMVVLGRAGAERLPKTSGRLLFVWEGRLVEAQTFRTDLPGTPQITGREIDLARWAIDTHNGRLSIPLLVTQQNMPERDARELLDVWQSRGWLDGSGQGVARRISPGLQKLVCQSVKVLSKRQSDCQSSIDQ